MGGDYPKMGDRLSEERQCLLLLCEQYTKERTRSRDYGIINHMFPFTPVELHAGWLIGKERILTAKSGHFHWSHPEKPIVLAFDSKGYKIEPRHLTLVKNGNGWDVDLAITDWQSTAVIENASAQ